MMGTAAFITVSDPGKKATIQDDLHEFISKKSEMLSLSMCWELGLFPIWGLGNPNCCYQGINSQNAVREFKLKQLHYTERKELKGKAGWWDIAEHKSKKCASARKQNLWFSVLKHEGALQSTYNSEEEKCTPEEKKMNPPTERQKKLSGDWPLHSSLGDEDFWSDIHGLQVDMHSRYKHSCYV